MQSEEGNWLKSSNITHSQQTSMELVVFVSISNLCDRYFGREAGLTVCSFERTATFTLSTK